MADIQTTSNTTQHGMWSNRTLFVLAAVGSAVGLGNIWKFPYMMGEHGGGAFFLVYLLCIVLIGFPVMAAEITIGREGRSSPVNALLNLTREHKLSSNWSLIGWLGIVGAIVILSFYAVIAGWILHYTIELFAGSFNNIEADTTGDVFDQFLSKPWLLLLWFTIFLLGTFVVVARGVNKGLETAIRICMPLLFLLLLVMLVYGIAQGGLMQSMGFMLDFDFSKLTWDALLDAMGHAFFTLSIGMGAIMAYGAYMPREGSVKSAVSIIVVVDTLVAIVAGLAIFSIVFSQGLEEAQSVGLLFVTAPEAFGSLPLGWFFGGLFFLFVSLAAFTSAISLAEPSVAYFVEKFKAKRWIVAAIIGAITWFLGLLSVFSFNVLGDFKPLFDWTFFDLFDKSVTWFVMPLGGLFIVIFVGYFLPWERVRNAMNIQSEFGWKIWLVSIRYIAPLSILAIFLLTLYSEFLVEYFFSNPASVQPTE